LPTGGRSHRSGPSHAGNGLRPGIRT
jgi:hypothetical protein